MDNFGMWSSPSHLMDDGLQMETLVELQDNGFEPQTRARSNTWPLPRPDNFVEPCDESESNKCSNQQLSAGGQPLLTSGSNASASKKNSSRRNAWGNLSYADLITQAISSAPETRLTLSQIYEWMVQNVPYFKDKGDSNSSAGWKNSIRHNLSLHNRFMRVQNEGTGKSSWWMLNPDAKPGKSVRRRAASMETSKFEKRRGRAKKRVEALRNGQMTGMVGILNDATPSPSSSVSEGLDLFPESPFPSGFQLSPDFRQRASSNASSVGRLSPIPSVLGIEPDWFDPREEFMARSLNDETTSTSNNHSTKASNPISASTTSLSSATQIDNINLENLEAVVAGEDTLDAANLCALDALAGALADDLSLRTEFLQGFNANQTQIPPPPPPYQQPPSYALHAPVPQAAYGMVHPNQCPIHRMQQCTCLHMTNNENMSPASGTGMSPSYPHSDPSPDQMGSYNTVIIGSRMAQRPPSSSPPLTPTPQTTISATNGPSTLMGQFMEALNNQTVLDDLGLTIDTFQGELPNVDEVIKHELSMDGSLDFNFPMSTNQQQQHQQQQQQQQLQSNNNNLSMVGAESGLIGNTNVVSPAVAPQMQYPTPRTSVNTPSWVH